MVTIRGKVKDQITGREAEEHIDKLAKKYLGKTSIHIEVVKKKG
jgi:hypothetical protein